MHVKLTLLLTNSMQTKQQIENNDNLKKISLPKLRISGSFFVYRNPNLEKMCASELKNGGEVCIGNNQRNNQPFLDADLSELSELESFIFSGDVLCYQNSIVPTVCGSGGGLFSTGPFSGCPSNACL
ncbi:hypothetical protein PPROV_000994900 [Pycnococcus provasolii]|uniref:Receptor L-domain domain-containing protein n=1 Tax=Pycnococcus provasolii TaxID=41880 RepID=A0A830HZF6_9CHLO|nr:hypothetical protein PPROV_000994900 [Pycnococcus provasolii]|mmetsp:Transcript_9505/g.21555  ORF Transcript_9505/g.21555 Transcript_9505/m.21555 type:complete len:127 (+) Transcript_9505:290-670(+)